MPAAQSVRGNAMSRGGGKSPKDSRIHGFAHFYGAVRPCFYGIYGPGLLPIDENPVKVRGLCLLDQLFAGGKEGRRVLGSFNRDKGNDGG